MKKLKKIFLLLVIASICLDILDFLKFKSNATENAYNIAQLNTKTNTINSHEQDTQTSNLELDYRNIIKLIKGENLEYVVPVQSSEVTQEEDHMGYPRLKKLSKETQDGYKYLLTLYQKFNHFTS